MSRVARVILAGFYPPPYAGEPIHVKQLAQFLRARGLDVRVLNLNRQAPPSPEYLRAEGRGATLRMLFILPERLAIVHLHTNGHNWKSWLMILTVALAARLRGARALLTIHSGLFPGYASAFGPLTRRLARWVLRSFERVIAVNSEIERAMHGLGLSPEQVALIPAFLGVPQPGMLDEADRRLLENRRPLLVAVGGGDRDPELGLPVVVDALPALVRRFPTLRALFVGWQVGPKTRPLIEGSGLAEQAICLGEVSHDRCLGLLQEADIVVRSTYADGDAITVREALDLGVPVVASDTAFRPAGVVLFRKGDARDLLAKIEGVLAAPGSRPDRAAGSDQPARDLWRIYAGLVDQDPTLLPASRPSRDSRAPVTPP